MLKIEISSICVNGKEVKNATVSIKAMSDEDTSPHHYKLSAGTKIAFFNNDDIEMAEIGASEAIIKAMQ